VKTVLAVLVGAAFVTGMVGVVAAQTSGTTTEKKPAAESKGDGKMMKKSTKTAVGTVKSASPDSIVVAGKEKGKEAEWTFAVDPKTKIKKGGKDITAADLKAGDQVSVRYMEHEGKAVAQAINVKAAPMAKKSEAKPAAEKK
jgi:hypothetical protein